MRLSLRDPRTRAILLVILILLLGGLTLHLVGMSDHGMGMAIGACLAIVVAMGLLVALPPLRPWLVLAPALEAGTDRAVLRVASPTTRPPPRDGTVQLS